MLTGKKILIGITGGIAAYKIPLLIRLLKKEGAEVKVIASSMALEFVTPLTLSTLSGHPIYTDFHNRENGEWNSHVDLGMWADLFLIAPVTANTMGKMVNGIADNLLLTTYLSVKCPVLFAPAMDLDMYKHPSTKANVKKLVEYGHYLIEPTEGELASGLCGEGRMEEPESVFEIIKDQLKKKVDLEGKKVLVSAGPTHEAIDPVRFIANRSTGLMGYSIAEELANRGAEVLLVSGPSKLKTKHQSIITKHVISANEMYRACVDSFAKVDIAIMTAAVADYKPALVSKSKIKKSVNISNLELVPTADILAELGKLKTDKQFLVGFALETDDEEINAKKKLNNKNLDFIVLNSLNDEGAGFGVPTNRITILEKSFKKTEYELKSKTEVARDIVNRIVESI